MNTTLISFILTSSSILDHAHSDTLSQYQSVLQDIIDVANNHHITVVQKASMAIHCCMNSNDFEHLFGFFPDTSLSYSLDIHLPLDTKHVVDRLEIYGDIKLL